VDSIAAFDQHVLAYDRWFDEHADLYQAELAALCPFVAPPQLGLEVGVGTGRFAVPLGLTVGVEPSARMAQVARQRGVRVCQAVGERLPFRDGPFDLVLLVTVICFVAEPAALLREAWRVLRPGARLVVGFIDRDSALGRRYETRRDESVFYRTARFYAAGTVAGLVRQAGFDDLHFRQTLFARPDGSIRAGPARAGVGVGGFVAVSARKPKPEGRP